METNINKKAPTFSKAEAKEIGQFYIEKYVHILNLIQNFPRHGCKSEEENFDNEPGSRDKKLPSRLCPSLKNEKSPAKTVDELLGRLSQLKGVHKLGYKDKLLKKSLKNKLIKKEKKDRKKQKLLQNKIKVENCEKPQKKQKPVFNSEGQMIFSKFDFSVLGAKKSDFKKSTKDPKAILKKVTDDENKIKTLKNEGKIDIVREMVEKKAVKTALMRCEGISVKDDPELLKKSIKKIKTKKEKSAKKWREREKQVRKDQEERQKKRQKNIQNRAHRKKLGKMKKAAKKGRIIPGF